MAVGRWRQARTRTHRVAILYNTDYLDRRPQDDPGYAANAEVERVARAIAAALGRNPAFAVEEVSVADSDLQNLVERLHAVRPDVVFNLCESLAGDARLAAAVPVVLEGLGIPYTGSGPRALRDTLDKARAKAILAERGIPTPPAQVMCDASEPLVLDPPVIVKPLREDASIGIDSNAVAATREQARERVAAVVRTFRQPALVERYVDGREFNVSLLGWPVARVLPLSEIDFGALPPDLPRIVSYEAKWCAGSAAYAGTPARLHPSVPVALAARIRRVASGAFAAFECRDYGRVDIRVGTDGVPYVIEVNPNCDLDPEAGLARAAAAVGFEYPALVASLVRHALKRSRKSSAAASG